MISDRALKIFRVLLIAKLTGLALFFLVAKKILFFGERYSLAVEAGADPSAAMGSNATMGSNAGAAGTPSSTSDAKNDASTDAAGGSASGRQGYLEGLLQLPSINAETSKKDEIGRFISLAERAKQQAEDRMLALNKRAGELQSLERSIDEKLQKLDEEKTYFATTIQKEKDIQEERLTSLIALYGKMEPKKAAPIFETMDKDLAVALIKKMKDKQVTAILEVMAPDKSKSLTEYYSRIRSGKEYDILKEVNSSLRSAFDDCKGLAKSDTKPELKSESNLR